MSADWVSVLLAYLHDPPDKALSIRGHVPRARDSARVAIGDQISRKVLEEAVSNADPLASLVERLPMPRPGSKGERTVGPVEGRLYVVHPLSGVAVTREVPELNHALTSAEHEQVQQIVAGLAEDGEEAARNRFLATWRLWQDSLVGTCHSCFAWLPADTRTPDHSIWQHLDTTAAFQAAVGKGQGWALLAFALSPVQRFIEASRSVRDLWSGSMILSWLVFRAMLPMIETLGPTALIYPALRGNPLLDLWLRDPKRLGDKVAQPPLAMRLTPTLPHRFLALVPWGPDGARARELAAQCHDGATRAWNEMGNAVRQSVSGTLGRFYPRWDKHWDSQIQDYFSPSSAVVPLSGSAEQVDELLATLVSGQGSFATAFAEADAVRQIARAIPKSDQPGYPQDHAGRWQYHVELTHRSLAAHRSIRHVPPNLPVNAAGARFPQKCTLLGSFEQMGPDELRGSRRFWDLAAHPDNGLTIRGVRIRRQEALSAVALVKRFAGPAFLADQLDLKPAELRFPDTWTVAAAEWLNEVGIDPEQVRRDHGDWNGQWLGWDSERDDPEELPCPAAVLKKITAARSKRGKAPVYYAILKLDGDDLGGWLRGERSPKVRDVMHPDLVGYYASLGPATTAGLEAKRPVGPALHAAISTALANFALHVVPDVVRKHHGTVIYSGGDDTLALLPIGTVLQCALELQEAYTTDWYAKGDREYVMMGSRATLSGGLVVVHAKDDLRLALQDVRRAEKEAKESGRDALAIAVRRRSGEHTSAISPWSFVPTVAKWTDAFRRGASDRWVYRLYAERIALGQLEPEAIKAEMRRQLRRAEAPTPNLLPPNQFVRAFDTLFARFGSLDHFLTLCHTASFLARGRDV